MFKDNDFMRLAIEQARLGDSIPGAGEVGCVIVKDGKVLVSGHNEAEKNHDPTAHAEIVTLRKLGQLLQTTDFSGVTLYCTLQPCGMCTVACIWARVSRIVFGARRQDVHSMYFDAKHVNTADIINDAFKDNLELVGGVLADECAALYYGPDEQPDPAEIINK